MIKTAAIQLMQNFVATTVRKEIHPQTLTIDAICNVVLNTTDTTKGGFYVYLIPGVRQETVRIGKCCQACYSIKV